MRWVRKSLFPPLVHARCVCACFPTRYFPYEFFKSHPDGVVMTVTVCACSCSSYMHRWRLDMGVYMRVIRMPITHSQDRRSENYPFSSDGARTFIRVSPNYSASAATKQSTIQKRQLNPRRGCLYSFVITLGNVLGKATPSPGAGMRQSGASIPRRIGYLKHT